LVQANVNKHIGIETLFVGAEHDPFSGPAFAAPMKNFIKNLTMKEVKNAGHW
jgi:pimeloyl-ACP methyl ester carboxylesterase